MSAALPYLLALYPLCLSGVALTWFYLARTHDAYHWITHTLACGSIVVFVFLTGPWALTSYYLRYVVLGLYALVAVSSYRRLKRAEGVTATWKASRPAFPAFVFVLFSLLDVFAVASRYGSGESPDLVFPLGDGPYYVLQGGSNVVTNPFHTLSGSRYAVDIVKLNTIGNRGDGLAPRELSAHRIFGEELHAPCQGIVLKVRDGLPDNPPGKPDVEHPDGNYLVLKCAETEIFMAHLMQGSIKAAPGEMVSAAQPIGRVGGSGNALEPHLHISAKRGGAEIPFKFDGRQLTINDVLYPLAGRSERN